MTGGFLHSKRFLLFLFIGFFVSAVGYQWAQARLSDPAVRSFIEGRAREILKADVKIGKVRYLPLARISLRKIQIGSPQGEAGSPSDFSIVQIEKLVLGYGLANLIRRDFNIPSHVVMNSPKIRFASAPSRTSLLDSTLSFSRRIPTTFEIHGGEFHYPWGNGREGVLREVRLKVKPEVPGRIRLEFASEISGIAEGAVRVHGFTDPQFRHYELEVQLKDVTFLAQSRIPLKKIRGNFHLTEKLIRVEGMTSLFHDWEIQWTGRVEDWQTRPKVFMDFTRKRRKSPPRLSIQMDFESGKLAGEGSWLGRTYPFRGKVSREGNKILFPSLEFPHDYAGNGEINRSSGDYKLNLHRNQRRFQIHSNLNRLAFQTEVELDHASVNHLDCVLLGRIRLVPLPKRSREEGFRFKGTVQTDYYIVEFEPLQNFQGSFELSAEGVEAMDFSWGNVFHLGGRVLFKGGEPREDLVLRVDGFPLKTIGNFAGRPIPANLSGTLEGKLKLRGELSRPEVQGYFTIKEGTLERLDFDQAIIQFQGFAPYLKLHDSKIFKGRSTLNLLGAIDLRLDNFFHGIQIKGPGSLVIWKGMSAFWKEGGSAIQAEKPLGRKLTMAVEVGAGAPDSQGKDHEESHAVVGPKVRF